ncbi:MAG: gamma carbonic anhydrase family protein [Chloroflexi bacterium]|nr:gamma carbonic anhydrase family protein [Chloroflexota bacterium]
MAGSLSAEAYVAPGAMLVGDVSLAAECGVFPGAVLRAEAAPIRIGRQANVQDNCVVEGTPGHPVSIGERVTLGHNARVFGATIDDRAMVAIGATVLPGAHVGQHAIVAANATVPENMDVPARKLVIGHGRVLRDVSQTEVDRIESGATEYARLSREYRTAIPSPSGRGSG